MSLIAWRIFIYYISLLLRSRGFKRLGINTVNIQGHSPFIKKKNNKLVLLFPASEQKIQRYILHSEQAAMVGTVHSFHSVSLFFMNMGEIFHVP